MPTKKRAAPKKAAPARKRPAVKNAGSSKEAVEARKQRFVEAYIANGENGTDAAIAAGFSKHTAASQASRLLTNVKVQDAVAARRASLVRKYELTTDLVVRSIVQELTFDPANLYDKAGQLLNVTDLDEDTRMGLTAVEFEQAGSLEAPVFVRKVKWAAKQGAREQAMKHLGMFAADNKQRSPLEGLSREMLKELETRLRG